MASSVDRHNAILWARRVVADPNTIYLDTETTGLDASAEIVEIAILNSIGATLIDTLVKPYAAIPADVSKIHGITDEMVAEADPWRVVWSSVEPIIRRSSNLVIYNAAYDLQIINQCNQLDQLSDLTDVTYSCAMLQFGAFEGSVNTFKRSYKWHKLDAAARYFDIDPGGHRARADADVCRRVVDEMAMAQIELLVNPDWAHR